MTRNDIYWKGLIEDLFAYFIPFFLPQYAALFDEDRPVEFLDKELRQLYPERSGENENRFVDKLVKLFTKDGEERWVLIHIEVQGYNDKDFARRMHQYFYRILDRYGVAVTAVAIYTDPNPSFRPQAYQYHFAGTEMTYRFNTYKVLHQDEAVLQQSNNPFAIAILTVLLALRSKKLDDENLLGLKVALVRQLYAKGFSAKVTRQLFNFIKLYVNFAKPETGAKFEQATTLITNQSKPMGLEEQILEMKKEEGVKEGIEKTLLEQKTLFVKSLLSSTDFDAEFIAKLAGVAIAFVQEIEAQSGL